MLSLKLGRRDRNVVSVHLQQTLHVALSGLLAITKVTHAAADSVVMCQSDRVAELVTQDVLEVVHRALGTVTSLVNADQG